MTGTHADRGRPDIDAVPHAPGGFTGEPGPLLKLIRDQRIAFLIVGGINTFLGTAYFWVWQFVMTHAAGWEVSKGHFLHYMLVLLMAHVCAVPSAFVLYRRAVFRVHGHLWRDLARFELVNLTAFGANLVLLPLVIEITGLAAFVSQLLVTVVIVVITYVGHREFSFRRKPGEDAAPPPGPHDPRQDPPQHPTQDGAA